DLGALLAADAVLTSTLTIEGGGGALWATHSLGQLTFGTKYDLTTTDATVVTVSNVPIAFDSGLLGVSIGAHAFTLGLGAIARRTLDEQSILVKLPSLTPATPTGLVDAAVAAVS